jgi:hypothetical protein
MIFCLLKLHFKHKAIGRKGKRMKKDIHTNMNLRSIPAKCASDKWFLLLLLLLIWAFLQC